MSYASVQAIRESSGLLSRVSNETPKGTIDGTNSVFVVVRRPIVDGDYDDEVTTDDVRAYVNGVPVPVSDVDATTGQIALTTPPAVSTKVTVDYQFSPITDEYTAGKQQESDSWVDLKLKPYLSRGWVDTLPLDPVPGIISTVAEMYAAGLILTRDWGNRVDTEQTSKDGYQKLKTARDLLADFIASLEADNVASNKDGAGSASVLTDGDVFSRDPNFQSGINVNDEDYFMRRQC